MSTLSDATPGLVGSLPTKVRAEPDKVVRRGCGRLRLGRVNGKTVAYRPPCGSRRCTKCQPGVIEKKMDRIPVGITALHATELSRAAWKCLCTQMRRQRAKGAEGSYVCVPSDYDTVRVYSTADIGPLVSLAVVEDAMFASRSEWGCISCSPDWRDDGEPVERSPDFHDEGMVTSSLEWIEGQAKRMGLAKQERSTSISYFTTDDEHFAMILVAGVGAHYEHAHTRVHAPHPWRRSA